MAARRLGFVDQFRGLATLFMIETHVLNALLLVPLREYFPFKAIDFMNGFVAPSFLFVAGFSFTLALTRKGDSYRKFSVELVRHLKRLMFIWITGYLLHVPYFSLRKTVHESTPTDLVSFSAVDILQCIAATLFLLHILRVLIKDDRKFNFTMYILFVFFVLIAPVAGGIDFLNVFPVWLAQYFNRMHGSLFPLFPWSSFLIGGTIASQFLIKHIDAMSTGKIGRDALKRVVRTGIVIAAVGLVFTIVETQILHTYHFVDYSPSWFLLRFGILLLILYGITIHEQSRRSDLSPMKLFGRESFLVYTAHLLVVYGSSVKVPSLVARIGPTLGYLECLGIFVALSVIMYIAAVVWNNLKHNDLRMSRIVQYVCVSIFFYLFINNPY
ncbi:MAG TPA: heparan-alpha-glucosaminide N-acetyltransferase domain-containing protein [Candidatus Kryptonia bacterium]